MAKELKRKIIGGNVEDKLMAFAITKKTDCMSAKDFIEIPFTAEKYVVTADTITDQDTGEVKEMTSLTIVGKDENGKPIAVGTNSPTVRKDFEEIVDVLKDAGLQISDRQMIIKQGISKNGRTFNSIQLVL